MAPTFYTHENPVWHKMPHSVVIVPLPGKDEQYEQFAAEEKGSNLYRLLCIPFFLYDLALGDVIEVDLALPFARRIIKVHSKSGRFVFRVWFENTPAAVKKKCLNDLNEMGALTERSSKLLYAVDAENFQLAQKVSDYLMEGESAGYWIYETGQS